MSKLEESFQFDLPEDLIAQSPPTRRGDSRLLLVDPAGGPVGERPFPDLVDLLSPGDVLVLNQSEVLPARLLCRRADTGGQVEILLIRPEKHGRWLALGRPARRLRPGQVLEIAGDKRSSNEARPTASLTVAEKTGDGQMVVESSSDLKRLAEQFGVMPLPPYIEQQLEGERGREQDSRDRRRYQTVYAQADDSGAASVAAPTAGLHFNQQILELLESRGIKLARVTLHVGPGTFQAPTPGQIDSRRLHAEYFTLDAANHGLIRETRRNGGRVVAVGTTSLRVLETVARLDLESPGPDLRDFGQANEPGVPVFSGHAIREELGWRVSGDTRLFIRPPDKVQAADGLLTNFHLPGSSLLMLVAALLKEGIWPEVYRQAIAARMRFYSYGDCMLILPGIGD